MRGVQAGQFGVAVMLMVALLRPLPLEAAEARSYILENISDIRIGGVEYWNEKEGKWKSLPEKTWDVAGGGPHDCPNRLPLEAWLGKIQDLEIKLEDHLRSAERENREADRKLREYKARAIRKLQRTLNRSGESLKKKSKRLNIGQGR